MREETGVMLCGYRMRAGVFFLAIDYSRRSVKIIDDFLLFLSSRRLKCFHLDAAFAWEEDFEILPPF